MARSLLGDSTAQPSPPERAAMPDPRVPAHRDAEYDQRGFGVLSRMQDRHFWYRGRHRFLLRAVRDGIRGLSMPTGNIQAVDLGGGCGGWLKYLQKHAGQAFGELALADSSPRALELAGGVLGSQVGLWHVDLCRLGWRDRWDIAFLLDVLEHIPDHEAALRQVCMAMRSGGLLFVAAPALQFFWSYNDEVANHVRRYSRRDLAALGARVGMELLRSRYFMFLLSPLVWLSRAGRPKPSAMSRDQALARAARSHRTPAAPINFVLSAIFCAETPLGLSIPFPWGTSVLGVFRKPGAMA